jgi:hydroxyacylglutathione hydrolase
MPAEGVIRVSNTGFASNTYIHPLGMTGRCLVIDPGVDPDALDTALTQRALTPVAVFATHGHFDHLAGAEILRRKYSAQVHFHGADERIARGSNLLMMAMNVPHRMMMPAAYVPIEEGRVWDRDGVTVDAIHVPGHTPGSLVLRIGELAFSGDTLYRDDVFLVRLPEQDTARLTASIERLWDELPESTRVYPGHGGSADFAGIKASNAPLRRFLGRIDGGAA